MRLSLTICYSLLGLAPSSLAVASPQGDAPSPPNTDPEGTITSVDYSLYKSEASLQQVQLLEYVKNVQVAIFQYGIENIPKYGFGKYARDVVKVLKTWKTQAMSNVETAELVLKHFNKPTVPPCKYTFAPDILGTILNSTDSILGVTAELIETGLGQDLTFAYVNAPDSPFLAAGGGASASIEGGRDAYLKSIVGGSPTPAAYGTVVPLEFAYWVPQYYIKPGSCPTKLKYGPLNPLRLVNSKPDATSFTPATSFPNGATITFDYGKETERPKYAAFLNQVLAPVFVPLTNVRKGQATTVVPGGIVGNTFVSLTSSKEAKNVFEVPKITAAGPFVLLIE